MAPRPEEVIRPEEPVVILGTSPPPPWTDRAVGVGHRAGALAREARRLMARGRELSSIGREYLAQLREPEGRQKHVVSLLLAAAAAGVLLGLLTGGHD